MWFACDGPFDDLCFRSDVILCCRRTLNERVKCGHKGVCGLLIGGADQNSCL